MSTYTKQNPHTKKSTYQNPHTLEKYPYKEYITYIIDAYSAPTTIGEESIPNYNNVLKWANQALEYTIDQMLR